MFPMEPLETCIMNNLFLLKLRVAMELRRRGAISVGEFEELVSEEIRKFCPNLQGDLGGYLFYFLDIIDINGEKVVLSRDGEHYVEAVRALQKFY
ncbi:MAG: hypothetical protein L7G96_06465 [Vulcanisaeta sp.]|nr:hypothetical protein [Vulcanisaeta sp.]